MNVWRLKVRIPGLFALSLLIFVFITYSLIHNDSLAGFTTYGDTQNAFEKTHTHLATREERER